MLTGPTAPEVSVRAISRCERFITSEQLAVALQSALDMAETTIIVARYGIKMHAGHFFEVPLSCRQKMAEEVGEDRARLAWDVKKIDFGTQASGNGNIMLLCPANFAHNLPFTAHEAMTRLGAISWSTRRA